MIVLDGKGVCGGYAFGPIAIYARRDSLVKRRHTADSAAEFVRADSAIGTAKEQLAALYGKALAEVGEANAQIFEIHQMMLEDADYLDSVHNIIAAQKVNAEYAVATTADNFAQMFSAMEDDYMRARAADVRDISERVLRVLTGAQAGVLHTDIPVILAAEDLAPSETVQLDKSKILSFVTKHGSASSHTAILARMMNIPAVIGLGDGLSPALDGKEAIVDGFAGRVYIEPDAATTAQYRQKAEEEAARKRRLHTLKGKENITLDGRKVDVFANIGGVGDVAVALQNDAGGIGLFRSEFLYLQTEDYPTEEEQFQAYKTVAETMAGRKVIVRTLDIGADKQIGYFQMDAEENPALGYRAIRICLDRPAVFRTQLRAIYRASAFGNIAIMFPMITDVAEVQAAKAAAKQVRKELAAQGIPYGKAVELGIMVETPAAVMVSDLLAKEVDFFSVGTNDLTQYTLAVDRQNPKLEAYYRPHHTGLLRMLKITADNIHRQGGWIGICGELAADTELTEMLLAIGFDEFSVSPGAVYPLREKIRATDLAKSRKVLLKQLDWQ